MPSIFETAEAWEATLEELLPVGNHVGKITNPKIEVNKKGNPEITLRVENSMGYIGCWISYNERSIGKLVQLYDAAGAERPRDGEFDPISLKLTDLCVERLDGKSIGVLVREAPSMKDPNKMFRSVGAYCAPSKIHNDMPVDSPSTKSSRLSDEDIPF